MYVNHDKDVLDGNLTNRQICYNIPMQRDSKVNFNGSGIILLSLTKTREIIEVTVIISAKACCKLRTAKRMYYRDILSPAKLYYN